MTKSDKRPQQFCIFCNGPRLSKEHIFARWLQPHLPKSGEKNHTDTTVIIKNLEGTEERKDRLRSGDGYEGSARVVCESCNNGWMSELQEAAKPFLLPMVQGKSLPLFVRQLRILAGWAAMFCMVAEARRRDVRFIASTGDERRFLMQNGVPPASWRVWAGNQPAKAWPALVHHTAVRVVADDRDGAYLPLEEPIVPNTAATTFFVGPVLFHCFRSHVPRVLRKQEVEDLQRVFPVRSTPVVWPPQNSIDDARAQLIATAFNRRLKDLKAPDPDIRHRP